MAIEVMLDGMGDVGRAGAGPPEYRRGLLRGPARLPLEFRPLALKG